MKKRVVVKTSLFFAFLCLICVMFYSCGHVHEYGEWITTHNATCTDEGLQERLCSCGDKQTQSLPASGHSWGEWVVSRNATCVEEGLQERICSCGEKQTLSISSTAHNISELSAIDYSCTVNGLTAGKACTLCGQVIVAQNIVPARHTIEVKKGKAATCEEDGTSDEQKCSVCGKIIAESQIVPALGHKVVTDAAVSPTCAKTGLTEGSHCSVCKKIFVEQETVDKTNTHSYSSGVCKNCGKEEPREDISYSGKGDSVITNINLPSGSYYAEMTHNGKSNFIIKLQYGDNSYDYERLVNEIGNYSGHHSLFGVPTDCKNAMMEVKADGYWTVTFKYISAITTTNIKGKGDIVTGYFVCQNANNVVKMTHDGKSNFIVKVIEHNSQSTYSYETLANEIGVYSGSKLVNLKKGTKYYFSIVADGNWTIDLGYDTTVTTYNVPDIPSSENTESDTSSNDKKYSYNDAYNMNSYANNGMSYINKALTYYNKAQKDSTLKSVYYDAVKTYSSYALREEKKVLEIVQSHLEIDYTDGTTLSGTLNETISILNEIASFTITDSNSKDVASKLADAGAKGLKIQKGTYDLLSVFSN